MIKSSSPVNAVVIIPVLNEESSIGKVLKSIPERFKRQVIVVDNGSTDKTADIARENGAQVVVEPLRGYGSACLAGIARAGELNPDYLIFLDGDFSDYPEDMDSLFDHMIDNHLDLVIGSRSAGLAEAGALAPQARFGNWLATTLMGLRYEKKFTDLGPFRAVRWDALKRLKMKDKNYGWTMEMQIKSLKMGMKVGEIPVRYRQRIGVSKITGTIKGSVLAGYKILATLTRYSLPSFQIRPK